ncbi:MAG: RidA family protein [Spirosomataceae bacterium]
MKLVLLFLGSFMVCGIGLSQPKTIVKTDKAPTPIGPYSQAVKANGFIFVAGQIGLEPTTRKLVEGGIEKETVQVLENIKAILTAAGSSLNSVVNTTIYLKDLSHFEVVNRIYATYFATEPPARATIQVANLPGGASLQMVVVALEK